MRHAACIFNRFHVRKGTQTAAYARLRARNDSQPFLPFGELVLARRPGAHLWKSGTLFVYGVWLGRDSHTDEHIVGGKAGVFRTRTVRRLTKDKCWSAEAVTDMVFTPWRTGVTTRGRPPKVASNAEPILPAPLPVHMGAYRPAAASPPAAPAAGGAAGAATTDAEKQTTEASASSSSGLTPADRPPPTPSTPEPAAKR